jgi:hypothetical protein
MHVQNLHFGKVKGGRRSEGWVSWRSAAVFFPMIEEGVACHDIKEPRGFYLVEDIIVVRRKIRVVQNAHRSGV